MILITGIPSEPPAQLVTDAAEKANIPYLFFNQRNAHLYELSLKYEHNNFKGVLQIDGVDYDLFKITGMYIRMMDNYFLPEVRNKVFNYVGENQTNKSDIIHRQLLNWMEATSCRILNRPWDMLSNLSKPYQAQLISEAGFLIPPTCITNVPEKVLEFKKESSEIIFKSISSIRSIVKELDTSRMKSLNRVRYLPTQFQKKLEGTNIRVHVVGDVLFATKIESSVVDYRYAGRENEECHLTCFELPPAIKKGCFKLSKILNLHLCGIDLFLTNKNEYYCFEVNPSPGYSYYQQSTGQDIATAIVKWLEFGSAK
jgi:glutathione synthase/RimK-type ligase-like ATP-grasp enzyme